MSTGDNMNPEPLNTTTDYSVTVTTPGSGFSTLLMLIQLLLRTKKFHQKPEQELGVSDAEMKSNITWSENNFTTDGQANPKESKTTHEENNDVNKVIKRRGTPESLTVNQNTSHKRDRRQAGKPQQGTMVEIARLYTEISMRYQEITNLKKQLETCTNITNRDYEKKITNLENENKEKDKEIKALREELVKMKNDEETCDSIRNLQSIAVPRRVGVWNNRTLNDNFGPGSKIVIRGKAGVNGQRMNFNLGYSTTNALHIDNRWEAPYKNQLVLNSFTTDWGLEETLAPAPIAKGANFVVSIHCLQNQFKICINDALVITYAHRVSPSLINELGISNAAEITSIYYHGSK